MTIADLTDDELVRQLRSGSREALGELYERYKDTLYNYCYQMLKSTSNADDAVHDAFLKVWDKIQTLEKVNSFRAWLYAIVRYQVLNKLRDSKSFEDLTDDCSIEDDDPYRILVAHELSLDLEKSLDMIRPAFKELIVLRDFEGLSYTEIAQITGLSLASVRVHIFRATKALAKIYHEKFGDEL